MAQSESYNCSPACFQWWQNNLVGVIQKAGGSNVNFSGGNPGTVSFDVSLGIGSAALKLGYNYDGSSRLTVEVMDSPWWLPNSTILNYIGSHIDQCGC